jgi:hypothetical protein
LSPSPALAVRAAGISALYVAQKSGRPITFAWQGSIIH